MTEPEPVKRTSEIEEWTNRVLIHPMSRALVTRFARWGVSPNAVSLAGLALGASAAVAYLQYAEWTMVALGFMLMVGWHVMDGADGQLARADGPDVRDRAGAGRAVRPRDVRAGLPRARRRRLRRAGGVGVGLGRRGRREPRRPGQHLRGPALRVRLLGRGQAVGPHPDPRRVPRRGPGRARGVAWGLAKLHLLYLTVQHRTGSGAGPLPQRLAAEAAQPGGGARVAQAYRATHLGGVRRWNLLCSNYRTAAIAVACLAGSPVFFLAFEALALNVVFVGLLVMTRRNDRALLARLDKTPTPAI